MCDPASDYMTGSSMLIDGGIELPVQEMHRLEMPETRRKWPDGTRCNYDSSLSCILHWSRRIS